MGQDPAHPRSQGYDTVLPAQSPEGKRREAVNAQNKLQRDYLQREQTQRAAAREKPRSPTSANPLIRVGQRIRQITGGR